ncbi:MAG TPA: 2-dehydropantoate 2-reductase N-terminal domain-containing protein, partial [Solirubrobacteraceae bacterium]
MRFVVLGAGAVGGVLAARLHQAGFEVELVARGAHFRVIRDQGLTLVTPVERVTLPISVHESPASISWGIGDVVLLAVKSQDTAAAMSGLQATGAPEDAPVVCMQNGVENERLALRLHPEVYGAVVMAPTAHLDPGEVLAYGSLLSGIIDIGRYPSGIGDRGHEISAAIATSGFSSDPRTDIMRLKYAKLILNLGNIVQAICEPGDEADELVELARAEGRAALSAASIDYTDDSVSDVSDRWERIGVAPIAGRKRPGSSTWQSLARGVGAVETDYLNGEIVLLGRLHAVPTPVNARLCRLA